MGAPAWPSVETAAGQGPWRADGPLSASLRASLHLLSLRLTVWTPSSTLPRNAPFSYPPSRSLSRLSLRLPESLPLPLPLSLSPSPLRVSPAPFVSSPLLPPCQSPRSPEILNRLCVATALFPLCMAPPYKQPSVQQPSTRASGSSRLRPFGKHTKQGLCSLRATRRVVWHANESAHCPRFSAQPQQPAFCGHRGPQPRPAKVSQFALTHLPSRIRPRRKPIAQCRHGFTVGGPRIQNMNKVQCRRNSPSTSRHATSRPAFEHKKRT